MNFIDRWWRIAQLINEGMTLKQARQQCLLENIDINMANEGNN